MFLYKNIHIFNRVSLLSSTKRNLRSLILVEKIDRHCKLYKDEDEIYIQVTLHIITTVHVWLALVRASPGPSATGSREARTCERDSSMVVAAYVSLIHFETSVQ